MMRTHKITTMSRRRRNARRRRALALALAISALAIPASAGAQPTDGGYSSVNATTGGSGQSSQVPPGADYSSVNSISPPASEPSSQSGSGGSPSTDSGYTSVNAITGAPASEPTLVTGSPAGTSDGFDWVSAAVGAGAAMALAALAGALRWSRRLRRAEGIRPSGVLVMGAEPRGLRARRRRESHEREFDRGPERG
jgi:hypothetical protein